VEMSKPASVKVPDGTFFFFFSFSKRKTADDLAGQMMAAQLKPVTVQRSRGLYKVWIGPYASELEIQASIERVVELGYESPHRVSR